MKNLIPYALSFAFGLCLMFFIYDKFHKKETSNNILIVDTGARKIDSINFQHKIKESKLKDDSASLSQRLKATVIVYHKSVDDLNEERTINLSLSNQIRKAGLMKDTSSYYTYCDSLSNTVLSLDKKIGYVQAYSDSVSLIKDSTARLYGVMSKEWKKVSEQLTNESLRQSKVIDSLMVKIHKHNGKKYTVTVGPFGGITPLGFTGGVGIVVGKKILTF